MKYHTITEKEPIRKGEKISFNRKTCAITAAMQILGGKWKILIISLIQHKSPARFGELLRTVPGITQAMLALQLRELERDGIISRKVYPQVPPRVEYELTELGQSLKPVSESLRAWGALLVQEVYS